MTEPALLVSYEPPPKPGPSYECKRADLDTQAIGGSGGEVFTKGACDAATSGPNAQWPLSAPFQITQNVVHKAAAECLDEWMRRGRDGTPPTPFSFSSGFPGKIHIRYCFLNMAPTVSGNTASWHVDCGEDGIDRDHIETVPLTVHCDPGTVRAAPLPRAERPVLSPPPGRYDAPKLVQVTTSTPAATIFYRAYRAGQPRPSQPTQYLAPISVSGCNFVIEASAARDGYTDSLTAVGSYDIVVPAQPGQKRLTKDEACRDPKDFRPLKLPTREIPRMDNSQRSRSGTPPTKMDVTTPKTMRSPKHDKRGQMPREQEREIMKQEIAR